jgi:hypothetical protein
MTAFVVMLAASCIAARNPSITNDGDSGPDWDRVGNWIRHETPKSAKFLTTTTGANFSIRSLRSSVSVVTSTVTWIAPDLARESKARASRVLAAQTNGKWDVGVLTTLAGDWDASYILVKGPFTGGDSQLLCRFGPYTVFLVRSSREC